MTQARTEHGSHRQPGALSRIIALVLAVGLSSTLLACSGSKSKGAAQAGSPSGSPSGSSAPASLSSAAEVAAITHAYVALFSPSAPIPASEAVLQDGKAFEQTLIAQSKTSLAAQASASVSKVVVTSANQATVTFSILISGSPVLKDQTGYAVREGGVWKVAGQTFCALLTAENSAPPTCKAPAATSLPG